MKAGNEAQKEHVAMNVVVRGSQTTEKCGQRKARKSKKKKKMKESQIFF